MEKIKPYIFPLFGYPVIILLIYVILYTGFITSGIFVLILILIILAISVVSFGHAVNILIQRLRADPTSADLVLGCITIGLPIIVVFGFVFGVFTFLSAF
jgi:hypothetical protein